MNKPIQALLLILALFSTSLFAKNTSLEDLVASQQLTIEVSVQAKSTQIVRQPLLIAIEVSTDRWFAKGTRVQRFQLQDTIIPISEVSINGTKQVKGQTWVTQRRELILYPMRDGTFQLPAITLNVSINTADSGIVEGVLKTTPQTFSISLPPELKSLEYFVVSPKLTMQIDGAFDPKKQYSIGDALTQTITFTASDTPAMMLPLIKNTPLDGVSIYKKPEKISDQSNRGEFTATRTESFTYIFEKAGKYSIPSQKIPWWNSRSNSLSELIIPENTWTVGGEPTLKSEPINTSKSSYLNIARQVLILCVLFLIFAMCIFHYRHKLGQIYSRITQLERRTLHKKFLEAIAQKDFLKACDLLFKIHQLPHNDIKSLRDLFKHKAKHLELLEQIYTQAFNPPLHSSDIRLSDFKLLLKTNSQKKQQHTKFSIDKKIKLNERY